MAANNAFSETSETMISAVVEYIECKSSTFFSASPGATPRDGVRLQLKSHTAPRIQNSGSSRPLAYAKTL